MCVVYSVVVIKQMTNKKQIEKQTQKVLKNLEKKRSSPVNENAQYNITVEKTSYGDYWIDIFTDDNFFYKKEIEYLTKNLDFSFVCIKVENDKPVLVFVRNARQHSGDN